jgi:iron complex outermembrane receptor protein
MKKLLAATALTSLSFIAIPAFAQDSSAQGATTDSGIGEIVVTAQKRSENIQSVPIAISAVGSKFLESRGITSIDGLGAIAPNVKFERAPSNKTISQISIRGSVTINPAVTWEPAAGLYLNGVYIAKAQGSIFDVADLERVEILRGPQGTLYGRNALAGAVNLVPKMPSGELGLKGEVSYGNYDAWKGRAVLDLPSFGPFSLKLSGQIQKRDGFIKVVSNPYPEVLAAGPNSVDRTNDVDGKSGMVQLRFHPEGSDFTADYMFDYSKFDQRPDYAQLLGVNRNGDARDIFDPNSVSYPYAGAYFPLNLYDRSDRQSTASLDANPLYEKSRTYGHGLTMALDLGDATIKSTTAYRNLKWADSLDLDGSPLPVALTQRDTKFHSWSEELQVTGKALDNKLNYVAGLFYYKEKAETLGPQSFFGGGASYQSDYGSHTEALAAYAQLDYSFTDALKLTLGARYTHEKKDISRYFRINYDAANSITSPLVVADLPYGSVPDAKYNNFSPAVTLSYQASKDINVYARFAQGFKSGGFNGETNSFGAPTADCPTGAIELCNPYRPEKVNSYEVGLKTRLADGKVIFNVAAFWDEHKDIQLSVFKAGAGASSIVNNAAKARIRGLEIETVLRPVDALTINASLAFIDPKYKSYIEAVNGVDTDVSDNRAFPHTPKTTASAGVDVRVAQGDWGRLNISGDISYVSSYYTFPYALTTATASDQNANNTKSKGRTIVNMRAGVAELPLGSAKMEISLWVKNLIKENNPSNFIDFGPGFGGLTVGYFPDPRTYGLTVGAKL